MERKVRAYLQSNNMLSEGDGVVVGVSGGADSMCLLSILISLREEYKLSLLAVHVNHGIRGESADADEHFVEEFCKANNVTFECIHANVPELARAQGLTEEEAGRNLRYESFFEACKRYGYKKIAVAHNRDDNAETVLFNIARGSGISGMRGISATRETDGFTIIRPLLCCTRAEIEEYLKEKQQPFRTDETNLTDEYSRNRIRHQVLPSLKESINRAVSSHITEMASQAAEIEDFLDEITNAQLERMQKEKKLRYEEMSGIMTGIIMEADEVSGLHRVLRKGVLRRLLGRLAGSLKDIESIHILQLDELLQKGVGKKLSLPYGIRAKRDYKNLVLEKKPSGDDLADLEDTTFEAVECTVPGDYLLEKNSQKSLKLSLIPYEKSINIPKNNYTKYFDYDKINDSLALRTRMTGDFLCIRGKSGENGETELKHKSLKSWFIDKKIPEEERDKQVLLTEGNHVLWIIGERGDDAYPVTGETKTILKAELTEG